MPGDAVSVPDDTPPSSARAPGPVAALWRRARPWAVPALAVVVLGLLLSHAHKVDWSGAWGSLRRYRPGLLFEVWLIATASHALYGFFDLIARGHTGHRLPRWRTWAIAVTSYAFNLNLGSLVGGVALRARLYARAGLDDATVAQVVGVSLATNWLGYGLIAGTLFAAGAIAPPRQAALDGPTFRALGALMVVLALLYVVACARWQGRSWRVRGRELRMPPARTAVAQLVFAAANWALMGWAMSLLLGDDVPYGTALAVLMAASIVGLVTPIPGGLGVLEAIFLALLAGSLPQGAILGAVLAYRALYYLLPLAGAGAMYLVLQRVSAREAEAGGPPSR